MTRGSDSGNGRRAGLIGVGSAAGAAAAGGRRVRSRFQIFQAQLELLDLPVQLLRLPAELHALELEDQQLQVVDFDVLGHHHRAQRLAVE